MTKKGINTNEKGRRKRSTSLIVNYHQYKKCPLYFIVQILLYLEIKLSNQVLRTHYVL